MTKLKKSVNQKILFNLIRLLYSLQRIYDNVRSMPRKWLRYTECIVFRSIQKHH